MIAVCSAAGRCHVILQSNDKAVHAAGHAGVHLLASS
jgi:hypothetical protein